MLDQTKSAFKDVSIKGLRKKAGWGNETLRFILAQNFPALAVKQSWRPPLKSCNITLYF
jgi:hypothetical protein